MVIIIILFLNYVAYQALKILIQKIDFYARIGLYTKLEPNERVAKTNEFIKLLDDNNTDEKHLISAKGKKEFYGIKIKPTDNLFDAHYMKET